MNSRELEGADFAIAVRGCVWLNGELPVLPNIKALSGLRFFRPQEAPRLHVLQAAARQRERRCHAMRHLRHLKSSKSLI